MDAKYRGNRIKTEEILAEPYRAIFCPEEELKQFGKI
jgi:hypothetical protein